ncbi:MAG: molybdopterin-binding protein, partial [bacterium]
MLTLGDELLLGLTANGHLTFIGAELGRRGVMLDRNVTITDDAEAIRTQFRESWARAEVIITTGGLGPTCDDRTREAIAEAELLVLAVKPQHFPTAAEAVGRVAAEGPRVVSVMAGVRSTAIRAALGGAARVVRTMPNTPAAVRRAITAVASDADVVEADFQKVEQLFAS